MKAVRIFFFSAVVAWKRRICGSLFSYDVLTTNTSSLVDVEEGRNCVGAVIKKS